jgi:hypothetical protein
MSKKNFPQADNCRGRGPLFPFPVRLICGRTRSNGKSEKGWRVIWAVNFLLKLAIFLIKKAPASSRRGPTRKETYTPPRRVFSKP